MSRFPTEEMITLVKSLVKNLTGFEENSDLFSHSQDYILTNLAEAGSLYFVNKRDIDIQISGQAEKFEFHGFKPQADQLRENYAQFIPSGLTKAQLHDKLMVVKFLICLSESPTKYFLEHPLQEKVLVQEEEKIDWASLIDEWNPDDTSSSDESTSDAYEDDLDNLQENETTETDNKTLINPEDSNETFLNRNELLKKLEASVQCHWFQQNHIQEIPESTHEAARTAFHWDRFILEQTFGLIDRSSNVLTEYKVMREVMWQLWLGAHTAPCFIYNGDIITPRKNITIASVRLEAFTGFLNEFAKYINLLQFFRNFRKSLEDDSGDFNPPGIYFRYYQCLNNEIVDEVIQKIIDLELETKMQETGMTLLQLSNKLHQMFGKVWILKRIHDDVILDFKMYTPFRCAAHLLTRLRYGLSNYTTSKDEMDVYLTLYVGSLFRYVQIIDAWFNNDQLVDAYDEFIIRDNAVDCSSETEKLGYSDEKAFREVRKLNSFCVYSCGSGNSDLDGDGIHFSIREMRGITSNNFLELITTKVVEIGRNLHHLRMLRKITLLNSPIRKSLYEDFIERFIQKIKNHFNTNDVTQTETQEDVDTEYTIKFPAICPDWVKYPTEMDRLENLIDTSDVFLMEAFKPFFTDKPKKKATYPEEKLYEKISKSTRDLFQADRFVDETFLEILDERYKKSGYIIKDLFINEYRIEEHFELLHDLYLFKDGLISSWHNKLFQQMKESKCIGNVIWLSGQLQDLLMDTFPNLYDKCFVKVSGDGYRGTLIHENSYKNCELIEIEYKMVWPITVIIGKDKIEMYKDVSQFILQIKWGLFTLTRMSFVDTLEPKVNSKSIIIFLRRLKVCRFLLINQFSAIHHYVFRDLIADASVSFRKHLEKAENLEMVFSFHKEFIKDIHTASMYLKDYNSKSYGFKYLLYLVTKLDLMWNNPENADPQELSKLLKGCKLCQENLEKVMYPD